MVKSKIYSKELFRESQIPKFNTDFKIQSRLLKMTMQIFNNNCYINCGHKYKNKLYFY